MQWQHSAWTGWSKSRGAFINNDEDNKASSKLYTKHNLLTRDIAVLFYSSFFISFCLIKTLFFFFVFVLHFSFYLCHHRYRWIKIYIFFTLMQSHIHTPYTTDFANHMGYSTVQSKCRWLVTTNTLQVISNRLTDILHTC